MLFDEPGDRGLVVAVGWDVGEPVGSHRCGFSGGAPQERGHLCSGDGV